MTAKTGCRLTALLFLLVFSACTSFNMEKPRVFVEDIQPIGGGLLSQRFLIVLRLQNPNDRDLHVSGLDFNLDLNDTRFASGVSNQRVTIPRLGSETVLVAEDPRSQRAPHVYVPVEFRFPAGTTFKHYDMKWTDFATMTCVPCDDPELDARLRQTAKALFLALGGVSYGRCDLRVDEAGTPWVLEMNANCGLFYPPGEEASADYILLYDPEGKQGFVDRILDAAVARARRRKSARLAATRRRERREAMALAVGAEA